MTLHGHPVTELAVLPDGREVEVRVGIVEDSYVADKELNTVSVSYTHLTLPTILLV